MGQTMKRIRYGVFFRVTGFIVIVSLLCQDVVLALPNALAPKSIFAHDGANGAADPAEHQRRFSKLKAQTWYGLLTDIDYSMTDDDRVVPAKIIQYIAGLLKGGVRVSLVSARAYETDSSSKIFDDAGNQIGGTRDIKEVVDAIKTALGPDQQALALLDVYPENGSYGFNIGNPAEIYDAGVKPPLQKSIDRKLFRNTMLDFLSPYFRQRYHVRYPEPGIIFKQNSITIRLDQTKDKEYDPVLRDQLVSAITNFFETRNIRVDCHWYGESVGIVSQGADKSFAVKHFNKLLGGKPFISMDDKGQAGGNGEPLVSRWGGISMKQFDPANPDTVAMSLVIGQTGAEAWWSAVQSLAFAPPGQIPVQPVKPAPPELLPLILDLKASGVTRSGDFRYFQYPSCLVQDGNHSREMFVKNRSDRWQYAVNERLAYEFAHALGFFNIDAVQLANDDGVLRPAIEDFQGSQAFARSFFSGTARVYSELFRDNEKLRDVLHLDYDEWFKVVRDPAEFVQTDLFRLFYSCGDTHNPSNLAVRKTGMQWDARFVDFEMAIFPLAIGEDLTREIVRKRGEHILRYGMPFMKAAAHLTDQSIEEIVKNVLTEEVFKLSKEQKEKFEAYKKTITTGIKRQRDIFKQLYGELLTPVGPLSLPEAFNSVRLTDEAL